MNPLRYFTALMGFLAALLGIARDDTTLVWVAIGFLGSSFGVRMLQRYQDRKAASEDERGNSTD